MSNLTPPSAGEPQPSGSAPVPPEPAATAPAPPSTGTPGDPAPNAPLTPPPYASPGESEPRPGKGLSIAALILGIAGLVLAVIPYVTFGSWLVLIAALVVSIIALARKAQGKGMSITGLVLSIVGFVVAVVMAFVTMTMIAFAALSESAEELDRIVEENSSSGGGGSDDIDELAEDIEDITDPEPAQTGDITLGTPFSVEMDPEGNNVAEITIESAEYSAESPAGIDIEPENGGYLTLEVTWETAKGTTAPNAFYIELADAEGAAGTLDLFSIPKEFADGASLAAGESVSSPLSFDISDSSPYEVTVLNELLADVYVGSLTP